MASLHKTTKRHEQRRGEDPVTAAQKFYGAKKTEFREPKPGNAPFSHKKEPPPEGMPVIPSLSLSMTTSTFSSKRPVARILAILDMSIHWDPATTSKM